MYNIWPLLKSKEGSFYLPETTYTTSMSAKVGGLIQVLTSILKAQVPYKSLLSSRVHKWFGKSNRGHSNLQMATSYSLSLLPGDSQNILQSRKFKNSYRNQHVIFCWHDNARYMTWESINKIEEVITFYSLFPLEM